MSQDLVLSWTDALMHPLAGRVSKPRDCGLTMIIDKGLGMHQAQDLLEVASEHIDYIKMGFGTSALYPPQVLQQKIRLIQSYKVEPYPGGTFFEVALWQGQLDFFLGRCGRLGYKIIEISDGTIPLDPRDRYRVIQQVAERGFKVITEVGKKDQRDQPELVFIQDQILADLEAGASKVIIEARETGTDVILYDQWGHLREDALEELAITAPPELLIWEAPLKKQQQELILRFGPNVNLGNLQTGDALAVEALRRGLRGDTLRSVIQGQERNVSTSKKSHNFRLLEEMLSSS